MYKLYRQYFEHLCTIHPDLLHKPASDEYVFEILSIEQAFGDYRTAIKEKGFMFRLIEYTFQLDDQSEDARQLKQGGFIIAKYSSSREEGTPSYINAIEESEKIALEFAEKMIDDSRNRHPIFYSSINNLRELKWNAQIIQSTGDGNYHGWLCTFAFNSSIRNCLSQHPDANWKIPSPHNFEVI
jgi:hypothetical protein